MEACSKQTAILNLNDKDLHLHTNAIQSLVDGRRKAVRETSAR